MEIRFRVVENILVENRDLELVSETPRGTTQRVKKRVR